MIENNSTSASIPAQPTHVKETLCTVVVWFQKTHLGRAYPGLRGPIIRSGLKRVEDALPRRVQ